MKNPRAILFVCAAMVLSMLGRTVSARADALRVVVRLAAPHDAVLLGRVRGQTSDLDVELLAVSEAPLEQGYPAQLAKGRALAMERGAQVVVWFVQRGTRRVVYVADLTAERVLARALAQESGRHDASALDEAAALVVRSALRASLAGAALATPEPERVAEELLPEEPVESAALSPGVARAPASPPTPAPPKAEPPQGLIREPARRTRSAVSRAPRGISGWLALGAEAGYDGFDPRGRYQLGARLWLRRGALDLGVSGAFGLPARRQAELASVHLARHRAAVFAAVALLARPRIRISGVADVGLEVASMRVSRSAPALSPEPQRALLLALGLGLRLTYSPRFSAGRLALASTLGLGASPYRPVVGYRDGARFVRVSRLHAVEPRLSLELVVRL